MVCTLSLFLISFVFLHCFCFCFRLVPYSRLQIKACRRSRIHCIMLIYLRNLNTVMEQNLVVFRIVFIFKIIFMNIFCRRFVPSANSVMQHRFCCCLSFHLCSCFVSTSIDVLFIFRLQLILHHRLYL